MGIETTVAYEGVLTQEEYAEVQRLRQEFSSGVLVLMFGQSKALLAERNARYAGSVCEDALDTRISGSSARLPWEAVTAYAAGPSVLLLAGHACLPLARSLFPTDESWQAARAIITNRVVLAPPPRKLGDIQWRTVLLWLALLVVVFLAWHFAQMPHAK